MYKQYLAKFKKSDRKRQIIVFGGIIVVLVVIVLAILLNVMAHPQRSVAAYCTIYKQEKVRLTPMSNNANAYPSGVFDVTLNDAGQIANSFSKLDPVAPAEIEPQVKTLQKLYQKIQEDPSQAIAASLSGGSVDDSLKAWTSQHCK